MNIVKAGFLSLFLTTFSFAKAQDTFSIVAADSATKQVGGAGASCVDLFAAGISNISFLSELFPGKGAINTQASYLVENQATARSRMNAGLTPQEIIDWMQANDYEGDASVRQYGVVGFVNNSAEAAAFTGSNCMDVKFHRTGKINGISYSIQGNILLGNQVVDSMEARFIREPGDLKCKLMAALEGAKMVGADSRCAPKGTSALFAFLHVAQPGDAFGSPSYKIGVRGKNSAPFEPIDSLQKVFNKTISCTTSGINDGGVIEPIFTIVPNPVGNEFSINLSYGTVFNKESFVSLYNVEGRRVADFPFDNGKKYLINHLPSGTYHVELMVDGVWLYQTLIKQ